MPCLVGCVNTYKTGQLKTPIQADSPSPWVTVNFGGTPSASGGSGPYNISVGNKSSPYHHHTACIKSFKYGTSCQGGAGCTVEIYDEEGTSFQKWMDKLNKSLTNIQNDYQMKVQFGWTGANCTGAFSLDPSPIMTFLPQNITSSYESGKIKYTIQGLDLMQRVFESRAEKVYGSDDNKMPLKDAIQQLFRENVPSVTNVQYLRVENSGGNSVWSFKDDPKGVWKADQQNALATARTWIHPFRTDRDKGIFASWDSTSPQGGVIFWEDTFPGCNEGVNADARSLGTYIVNGGKCSPVISFQPSVQWNFMYAARAGGGTGGPGTSQPTKMPGQCNIQATGGQTNLPLSNYANDVYGPDQGVTQSAQSGASHERANMTFQPITAELKVQGDPSLCDPLRLVGKFVSIVVINPFHLSWSTNNDAGCAAWLATGECNPVFSNKSWMVKGVDHDIREGSYCTTISVFLAVPGSNIDAGQPLGGPGSGGYQFPS